MDHIQNELRRRIAALEDRAQHGSAASARKLRAQASALSQFLGWLNGEVAAKRLTQHQGELFVTSVFFATPPSSDAEIEACAQAIANLARDVLSQGGKT